MDEKEDEISIGLSRITGFFKKKKKEDEKPEAKEEAKDSQAAAHADASEINSEIKKDEDEISIDFSKIKNIFKKKEKPAEEKASTIPKKEKKEGEEDEISFDFSKIKNIKDIFKGKQAAGQEPEEDVSVDFKKIADFVIRYRALFLLLLPIFLSIFLRVQPAYIPITDEWAENSVISSIRSQISSQISQQYPNLPDQNRNALVENELQKVLSEQKSAIGQQIYASSQAIKSRLQDDSGQSYLPTIDPYYWLRFTKNIIENGHPGDEIKDGKPYDNHMLAPTGRGVPSDMFLAYFTAYLFKFLRFFNQNLNLAAVAFYIPVLISALAVIPAFFITKKIAGNFGGFIAAAILAMHPSFLTRTMGGIFDTDGFNVLLPLSITWIFLGALEAKSIRNVAILSALAGLLVGVYTFTWGGWWYIFDFILVSAVLYIMYYSFVHKKELMQSFISFIKREAIKNSITFFAVFFIASAISVSFFVSFDHFKRFYTDPTGFAKLKEVGITTIWPNVFTTVAEQNPASLNSVVDQVGLGKIFFFLIALIGISLTLKTKGRKNLLFFAGTLAWYLIIIMLIKVQDLNAFLILISIPIIIRGFIALWESDTEIDIKYAILLIIWFISTIYASTKGVRFTLLAVPPFAIGFGIALHHIYSYSSAWAAKALQINIAVSKAIAMLILGLLLISPYASANKIATNFVPDFNDAWAISLERIKEDSKADAIINSWWDFGHWFKYWADRPVTFDGTSQNTPPAHWVGKVLLTGDEKLAVGILRMLDCGSREGFNAISKLANDDAEAIDIMYEIMPLSRKEARNVLADKFKEEDAEKILNLTHCQPPENYFITSEDMIGKSGVWSHFGSWDFDRALIYNTLKKKEYNGLDKGVKFLQERFNYSKNDAERLFDEVQSITTSDQANNWIAPWPGYAGSAGCGKIDNVTLSCTISGIPLVVNLSANDVYAESTTGRVHPKWVSLPAGQGIILKGYNESVISLQNGRHLGIALVKDGESYHAVAMDSDLTGSMFTRLFYQEGLGLRYFKKFSDERTIFGGRIIVWKVDWGGIEGNNTDSG